MMDWLGSVGIGAVGHLASEELPPTAMQLEPPVWVITSDLIYDNGDYVSQLIVFNIVLTNKKSKYEYKSQIVISANTCGIYLVEIVLSFVILWSICLIFSTTEVRFFELLSRWLPPSIDK